LGVKGSEETSTSHWLRKSFMEAASLVE